jgi:PmbA protein
MKSLISLQEVSAEAMGWIKKNRSKDIEAELYLSRSEERGAELREGKLNGIHYDSSEGAGLRIAKQGRVGFASSAGVSLEAIKDLYQRALAHLPHLGEDVHKGFPPPVANESDLALTESLKDESLFIEEWDAVLPHLEDMERAALKNTRVSSALRSGYGEMRGEVMVTSTLGVAAYENGSSVSIGTSVVAKEGEEIQIGSSFQSARQKAVLDFQKVGREAAERAACLLGSRKMASAPRSVIFTPIVAAEFLDFLSDLLCADQVQRGKSLLAGKIGGKVASPQVSLIDDPRRLGGLASSLYDDEGMPTCRKVMVENGTLKEYFYDFYTSRKEGRLSNGSASRGSFKGLPGPDSSNFYLAPGKLAHEEIVANTANGIILLDVMGMHMADPISGEFSVGASGLAVERGRVTSAVKNAMISGNILDILKGIDAVGSDLTFFGSTGSPTFRVASLMVA